MAQEKTPPTGVKTGRPRPTPRLRSMRLGEPVASTQITVPERALRVAGAIMEARRKSALAGKGQPGIPAENFTRAEYLRLRFLAGHQAFMAQAIVEFLRRGRSVADVAKLTEETPETIVVIANQNGLQLDQIPEPEAEGAAHASQTIRTLETTVARLTQELAVAKRKAGRWPQPETSAQPE